MGGCLSCFHLLGTWPATRGCALTGTGISELLVCRPALSPLSHTSQDSVFNFKWFYPVVKIIKHPSLIFSTLALSPSFVCSFSPFECACVYHTHLIILLNHFAAKYFSYIITTSSLPKDLTWQFIFRCLNCPPSAHYSFGGLVRVLTLIKHQSL